VEQAGLRQLIGRELSSVEFVRDYVQLRFDGPCLSAYTMPTVQTSDRVITPSAPGYVGALVDRIGRIVGAVESHEEDRLELRFSDGVTIAISLRPGDYRAAEAATLTIGGDEIWSW